MRPGAAVLDGYDIRTAPDELWRKYDVRGPRYTSYPPANHFHPLQAAQLADDWDKRAAAAALPLPLGVYVHVPFCASRCAFCGCHTTVGGGDELKDRYLQALLDEIWQLKPRLGSRGSIRQLALGGGTALQLGVERLSVLLDTLGHAWGFETGAELSIELDPRTATPTDVEWLANRGFTRASLGLQDLEPEVLEPLRPEQTSTVVEGLINGLRLRGVSQLSLDLIYGLPRQTPSSAGRTAKAVLRLAPARIALFSYAHVPWLHPHQERLEAMGLPTSPDKLLLLGALVEEFTNAGYVQLGIDHFAREEDPLVSAFREGKLQRSFMGYTTNRGLDTIGIGASAISFVGRTYAQNEKDVEAYCAAVKEGQSPTVRGFVLDRDDELRRDLIMDLCCNLAADFDELADRHGAHLVQQLGPALASLDDLVEDGILLRQGNSIQVTPRGRYFVRNVCMRFDKHLSAIQGAQVYSRTV